jgi:nucleoporin SEH1
MNNVSKFDPGHEDLIHDIAYNYYGKRFVTCSSDQKVKVFDWDDDHGQWVLNDSWKAHDCSVVKVKWAHPEFGEVIASCSFDRSVRIWEEQETGIHKDFFLICFVGCLNNAVETKGDGRRWQEKARLVDSRGSVHDIEFAPPHLGLKLVFNVSYVIPGDFNVE